MKRIAALTVALVFLAGAAWSWNDHDNLTWLALSAEPWAGEPVTVRDIGEFLEAHKAELATLLTGYEAWAAENLPGYPVRPDAIAFNPTLTGEALVASFLGAIRVNPDRPLTPFYQPLPWEERPAGREDLPLEAVDLFKTKFPNMPFQRVMPGQEMTVLEVLTSACDEPDYGMDLGLYEDNDTAHGAAYGLGAQPYGNPALYYGSQAPLHMTFAREDPLIGMLASFTKQGLSEYRVSMFTLLARYALARGESYWGWRFAGWALHYMEDMAQPYHARLMPGMGTYALLGMYVFGSEEKIDAAVVLLSNRHLAVEEYQDRIVAAYDGNDGASPVFGAIKGTSGIEVEAFRAMYALDVVGTTASGRADALDRVIEKAFPAHYVSDPSYDYGADPDYKSYDPLADIRARAPDEAAKLDAMLAEMLGDLGAYARTYVGFLRLGGSEAGVLAGDPYAGAPPRKRPADLRGVGHVVLVAVVVGGIGALTWWGVSSLTR